MIMRRLEVRGTHGAGEPVMIITCRKCGKRCNESEFLDPQRGRSSRGPIGPEQTCTPACADALHSPTHDSPSRYHIPRCCEKHSSTTEQAQMDTGEPQPNANRILPEPCQNRFWSSLTPLQSKNQTIKEKLQKIEFRLI